MVVVDGRAKRIFRFFFYFARISLALVQTRTSSPSLIKWGRNRPALGYPRLPLIMSDDEYGGGGGGDYDYGGPRCVSTTSQLASASLTFASASQRIPLFVTRTRSLPIHQIDRLRKGRGVRPLGRKHSGGRASRYRWRARPQSDQRNRWSRRWRPGDDGESACTRSRTTARRTTTKQGPGNHPVLDQIRESSYPRYTGAANQASSPMTPREEISHRPQHERTGPCSTRRRDGRAPDRHKRAFSTKNPSHYPEIPPRRVIRGLERLRIDY